MASNEPTSVTRFLQEMQPGDSDAMQRLFGLVYNDLHEIAKRYLRRERSGHTLQPTALLHEAFLKLVDQENFDWQGKTHFFAAGAQAMRRILCDHYRAQRREKRGGKRARIPLEDDLAISSQRDADLLALDEALAKLAQVDPRQARIVELRFFGGMTVDEIANLIGVSKRTVEGDWTHAKAWLRAELSDHATG